MLRPAPLSNLPPAPAGALPAELETRSDFLVRIQQHAVARPSARAPGRTIPRELEAVCIKALAPTPEERYPEVAGLAGDVEAHLDGRLVGAATYSRAAALWKLIMRHRALAIGLLAMLDAAGSVAGVFLTRAAAARRGARQAVARLAPDRRLDEGREAVASVPTEAMATSGSRAPAASSCAAALRAGQLRVAVAVGMVGRAPDDLGLRRGARQRDQQAEVQGRTQLDTIMPRRYDSGGSTRWRGSYGATAILFPTEFPRTRWTSRSSSNSSR